MRGIIAFPALAVDSARLTPSLGRVAERSDDPGEREGGNHVHDFFDHGQTLPTPVQITFNAVKVFYDARAGGFYQPPPSSS
jgi:hypothetical protein